MKLHGNFVMLRAGNLRLMLPQGDVGAAEYLESRPQPAGEPGMLQLKGDDTARPYAALSPQMTLLPQCPEGRFVVAALGDSGDGAIGWCWDELQVLIGIELETHALPAALVAPHTPVDRFTLLAGNLAFITSAKQVTEFALASGVAHGH